MKFTVVNIGTNTGASGASLAITVGAAGVPAGATIFVLVTEKSTSGTSGTLADTAANSYSTITSGNLAALAADGRATLFAVTNAKRLVNTNTITYTRNLSAASCAMSAFYVTGASGAVTFTEGVATATGTTGTITVTSGSLGVGRLVLGALFASGTTTAGGSATFTNAASFVTPPNEATTGGSAGSRVDGGNLFKAASGTQVYAPTLSSTAQQWFLAVLGIIPAPETIQDIATDLPATTNPGLPYPVSLRAWTQNLLQSTLFTPPTPPDTQHVRRAPLYTNPRGYEYPIQLRNWWAGQSVLLLSQTQFNQPLSMENLAVPTPPIYPTNLRTWTWNSLPYYPPTPPPPPTNVIFRNPFYTPTRAPEYHVALRQWIGQHPPAPSAVPFAQYSWPLTLAVPAAYRALRTWTQSYNLNLIGQDKLPVGEIITDLPPGQRRPEPKQLHSWLWSYNLNLIGKDRLTVGKIIYDLAPRPYEHHAQLRTWTWNYNLNLIGQDQLPVGEIVYDLAPRAPQQPAYSWTWNYNLNLRGQDQLPIRQQAWPLTDAPLYHVQLRSWFGAVPPTVAAIPFAQYDWPNPRGAVFPVNLGTVTASYNLNLIGQDRLPVGEITTDLAPRGPQQPALSWAWNYNLNLRGQDQLPVRQSSWPLTDAPIYHVQLRNWIGITPPAAAAAAPFAQYDWPNTRGVILPINLSTITASYNLNLIGKDQLPVGDQITDALPQRAAQQPERTITASYNPNLVGQDRLPIRQQDWPNPQPVRWYQNWAVWQLGELELEVPFRQADWPVPRGAEPDARRTWTWNYNLNLIGKDQLPIGTRLSDLPPQPARRQIDLSNWINTVNMALAPPVRPFAQFDWPNPRAPQQAALGFTASYNLNLIGKDFLPIRQQDWPNPRAPYRAPELSTWIERVKLLLPPPIRQQDWPVPRAPNPVPPDFAHTFTLTLVGTDKLPIGKIVTDLAPRPPLIASDLRTWVQSVNLALLQPPAALPFNQYNWPNPDRGPRQPDRSFAFWGGSLYQLAPPPVDTTHVQRTPYYANPRGYQYPISLRTGFGTMPPMAIPPTPPTPPGPGISPVIGGYPKWRRLG